MTRIVGSHPAVGAITNAPVPEQEGVYLQGAIPHTAQDGMPGEFAFDPRQNLVEGCQYDTLETRGRLAADWDHWFPSGTPWRVEKSPVNLLRTRLYQQLFPLAHFIFVVRHPAAVAQASQKWSDAPLGALVRHWQAAYSLALRDLEYLHHALVVRYEDLCADPLAQTTRIFRFLDLYPTDADLVMDLRDGNSDYRPRPDLPLPAAAGALGYHATFDRLAQMPAHLACRHPLRRVREAVLSASPITSPIKKEVLS